MLIFSNLSEMLKNVKKKCLDYLERIIPLLYLCIRI